MQRVQKLALVLVDSLDLDVEDGFGFTCQPVLVPIRVASFSLFCSFDLPPFVPEFLVVGVFLQFLQLVQVGDPLVADRAE